MLIPLEPIVPLSCSFVLSICVWSNRFVDRFATIKPITTIIAITIKYSVVPYAFLK